MLLSGSGRRGWATGALLRPVAVISALSALEVLALLATRSAWHDVRAVGPASLDEAVLLTILIACVLVGGWVVLSTTVAVLAHLPGRPGGTAARWASAVAPAATRRVAALLVGAALTSAITPGTATGASPGGGAAPERVPGFTLTHPSPAAPATTQAAAVPSVTAPAATAPAEPVPGWTPSRPVHPSAAAARLVSTGGTPAVSDVVVHRGDSLWTIARRHLGPGATDVEVAAAWPHWYAANRAVIGPDPDVLLPGQVLRPPDRTGSDGHPVGARR